MVHLRNVNPVEDIAREILQLTVNRGQAHFGRPIALVAECQPDKTEVYIDWAAYVGGDSSSVYNECKRVTTRIGDRAASESRRGVSTDKGATVAPDWAARC